MGVAPRGSYAKGRAKREEILDRALDVIAHDGFRQTSIKAIADAAGLSQAGLLHYFDSKEHLFVEVLRTRDLRDLQRLATDLSTSDLSTAFLDLVRRNVEVPGLVELFTRMAAEAGDPDHPAHAYFSGRIQRMMDDLRESDIPLEWLDPRLTNATIRSVLALSDGLQIQWLIDPSIDMAGILELALSTLIAPLEAAVILPPPADDNHGVGTD